MFQETITEIIQRIENLPEKKKSIIELDIQDIKEEIQETLFKIKFTPENINDIDLNSLEKLKVSKKEALGLFFLTFITTLRHELSYNSFWVGIEDALMEFEEDNNTFFADNYFEDSELHPYLIEAINDAIARFNLRTVNSPTHLKDTLLLQMGLLNRFNTLNYWLTSNSKNSIIHSLTNRANENFSELFFKGWKVLQRYSKNLLSKKETLVLLNQNVWFKDFNLEDMLNSSRIKLHSSLISRDEIENLFYLQKVQFSDDKLQFFVNADDLYTLNLTADTYDLFIDEIFQVKLLKNSSTHDYYLETPIIVNQPENYKIKIEIKDENTKVVFENNFVLFDFNHDILIFDEDGKWTNEVNTKLDETKIYSILIDSDFEIDSLNSIEYDYFDGYVQLITNITKDSNFSADDGDKYQFNLNFTKDIQSPTWLNNIELYAESDFLSFDEPIEYNIRYNNIAVSARQTDSLVEITEDMEIVRWSYTGGVIYDLDAIENYNYKMDLSYDILINRKNTLKIKIGDTIFTKQLNVTLLEKTSRPKYRTFLRDEQDNITLVRETNRLTNNDIASKQIVVTSFHQDLLENPEQNNQMLRDKANIYDTFELNKFFTIKNHPFYGEEISSVKKIYDDVQWNTFCSVLMYGIVKNYDEKTNIVTLHKNHNCTQLTLVTLNNKYELQTHLVTVNSNTLELPFEALGFCLLEDSKYVGSYFFGATLDIETIFSSVDILKFLRLAYYPFAHYFNGIEYEQNRALREKARNEKKKQKRLLRLCIKNNPTLFLQAFIEDTLTIDESVINLQFKHSKTIAEQILFAIEFDAKEGVEIIHKIILNRWQEKVCELPLFLIFLLNVVNNDRYYEIFLDELSENISQPENVNEEFINRMVNALLSDHKIDRYEKINIKTITQSNDKDFYIHKSLTKLIEKSKIIEEDTNEEAIENEN